MEASRWRVRIVAAVGIGGVLAGLLLNPWSLEPHLARFGMVSPGMRWSLAAADALLVLGGAVLIALRRRISPAALLLNLVFPFALLALAEATLLLVVRLPWLPVLGRLLEPERQAYLDHRHTIQYDRDCARYDDELAYTLRPGDCTFTNDEFSTRVHVNRLGRLDDEFVDALDGELAAGDTPHTGSRLRTLRLADRLDARRHYFRLDDHMNAAGHRAVADALVEVLPELGIRPRPAP